MALSNRIQLNEETRTSRQLLEILDIPVPPGSSPQAIREIELKRVKSGNFGKGHIYAAFDETGSIERYAFPISGKGLWGPIQGLLAIDGTLSRIDGVIFTSHTETPGLGARIDEKWFRDQFSGADLSSQPVKDKFLRVESGSADQKNRFDAISGATITSKSVENMLNNQIKKILSEKEEIREIDWASQQKK